MMLHLLIHYIYNQKDTRFYSCIFAGILLQHVQWSHYAGTARSQDTSQASAGVSQSATTVESLDI